MNSGRLVICFAAHPDDETIGVGGQLPCWPGIQIVYATGGAPRNMADANRCGFSTADKYAAARRAEVIAALGLAGIKPAQVVQLGFVDQECALHLADLTRRVRDLLLSLNPEAIFAPPYEGGHPDHDSVAFAVHAACRTLTRGGHGPPPIFEYALYHSREGHFCAGEFLAAPDTQPVRVDLSSGAQALKRRMLGCFVTQRATLAPFSTSTEVFRGAPRYDFGEAPHQGALYYEGFPWGVTGPQWRALAGSALTELGMDGV